jgi:hypothetical protein
MSWVIVRDAMQAQAPPMTWEEDTLMDRLRQLFRSRGSDGARRSNEAQRTRSNRMRYFLTVFGSQHWATRVEGRRIPARRGNIAL